MIDYTLNFESLDARADACRAMIHARAVAAYFAALGMKPVASDCHLNMCVIHNSLVSREDGKPWADVDYQQMRLARHLVEKSFEPGRLVRQMFDRQWRAKWDARRAS